MNKHKRYVSHHSLKTSLCLLCCFLALLTEAQAIKKKTSVLTVMTLSDSSRKVQVPKRKFRPYAGLHISGDAGMYYVGPSFQAGFDFYLRSRLLISLYGHYFTEQLQTSGPNGFFEKGKYRTLTSALLLQHNTAKKANGRSFFIGGGISLQYRKDTALTSYNSWNDVRTTLTPAFRIGYFFPVGKNKLTVELNGTGPYSYDEEDISVFEFFTQLSLGTRFIF